MRLKAILVQILINCLKWSASITFWHGKCMFTCLRMRFFFVLKSFNYSVSWHKINSHKSSSYIYHITTIAKNMRMQTVLMSDCHQWIKSVRIFSRSRFSLCHLFQTLPCERLSFQSKYESSSDLKMAYTIVSPSLSIRTSAIIIFSCANVSVCVFAFSISTSTLIHSLEPATNHLR